MIDDSEDELAERYLRAKIEKTQQDAEPFSEMYEQRIDNDEANSRRLSQIAHEVNRGRMAIQEVAAQRKLIAILIAKAGGRVIVDDIDIELASGEFEAVRDEANRTTVLRVT